MDFRNLDIQTWNKLDVSGDIISGYKSLWLAMREDQESDLHIFKDKSGHFHFAIKADSVRETEIENPDVNGLQITVISYKFQNGNIGNFIDLACNIKGYIEEFTEVVKEIARAILEFEEQPIVAVNQIINNWISFWSIQNKQILSEEDQIGLICELITLNKLCKINPKNALKSWTGPLGEKHDFNFTEWSFEVKGTRSSRAVHTVNGIEQLMPAHNKQLAFISFQLTTSISETAINLPNLIRDLIQTYLQFKPDLTIRFNELLSYVGYSPIHALKYSQFNVDVMHSTFFEIDNFFPKITSKMFKVPLNNRVSAVKYNISLEGIVGKDFNELNLGNYFY